MLYAQIEQWTMFAGISLMLVILLRRYWRYYGKVKRQNQRQERRSVRPVSRLKRDGVPQSPLADAPPEALRWQVEMHDTARDLKAELDSKIGVLQTLVRMADDRIAALAVATERHRAATAEHASHDRQDDLASGNIDSNLSDREPVAESTNAESTNAVSPQSSSAPENVTTTPSTAGSSLTVGESGQLGSESLRRSIFELAERGWDASSIATEIERPIGDVEMILSLRST